MIFYTSYNSFIVHLWLNSCHHSVVFIHNKQIQLCELVHPPLPIDLYNAPEHMCGHTSYTTKCNSFTDNILLTIDIFMPSLIHLFTLCPSLSISLSFSGFSLGGLSTQYTICHTQQLCCTNIQTPIIEFTFFPRITLLLRWQLFQAHNMYITYDSSIKLKKQLK